MTSVIAILFCSALSSAQNVVFPYDSVPFGVIPPTSLQIPLDITGLAQFVDKITLQHAPDWAIKSTLERCPPVFTFTPSLQDQGRIHHNPNPTLFSSIEIKLMGNKVLPQAQSTIVHEWFHHIAKGIAPRLDPWISEGLATWFDYSINHDPEIFVLGLTRNTGGLTDFSETSQLASAYAHAGLFFAFIADRYGAAVLWEILRFLGKGADPLQAFWQAFDSVLHFDKTLDHLVFEFETARLSHYEDRPILMPLRWELGPFRFSEWKQGDSRRKYFVQKIHPDALTPLKKGGNFYLWRWTAAKKVKISVTEALHYRDPFYLVMFY